MIDLLTLQSLVPQVLGQDAGQSASVTGVIQIALQSLLTPVGAIAALVGAGVLAAVAFRRDGAWIGGFIVISCMTMMYQESKYFDNTLILPLQKFREVSKVVTFAVLVAMLLNLTISPGNSRRRRVNFVLLAFLAFQTYFLLRLSFNGDIARAGLGWIADLLLFATLGVGFGKQMETEKDVDRFLSMFGYAAVLYVCLSVIQLVLGYREVVANNRFMGISGNPQLAGYICATMTVIVTHLFIRLRLGSPMRLVYGLTIGMLILLLLWTGSRTALLCLLVGMLVFFRFRIGSFAIVAAVASVVVLLAASFFAESFEGIGRLVSSENTRRDVWLKLLSDFSSAPLLGTINLRADENISASESTYLSTLSLLGISGAIPLAFLIFGIIGVAISTLRARLMGKVDPSQADVMLAGVAIMLVSSVFEGFFLGILAYAVVWNYAMFGLSAFFTERLSMSHEEIADVEGYSVDIDDESGEADDALEGHDGSGWRDDPPLDTSPGFRASQR